MPRSSLHEPNQSPPPISLPQTSFVAFRLAYSDPEAISEHAKCVFIGRVPDLLSVDDTSSLRYKTSLHARSKMKKKFKSTMSTIHSSVRSGTQFFDSEDPQVYKGQNDLSVYANANHKLKKMLKAELKSIRRTQSRSSLTANQNEDFLDVGADASSNFESNEASSLDTSLGSIYDLADQSTTEPSTYSNGTYKPHEDHQSPVKHFFIPSGRNSVELPPVPLLRVDSTIDNEPSQINKKRVSISDPRDLFAGSEVSFDNHRPSFDDDDKLGMKSVSTASSLNLHPKSTYQSSSKPGARNKIRGQSNITIATPQPSEISPEQFQKAAKEHEKFRKKIRNLATVSKGRAKAKKNDFRHRLLKSILKNYKAGEIIRTDKVLLLVKESNSVTHAVKFNETEPFDTRIYERWNESVMVFRRTDEIERPFVIQFYDIHGTNETKKKPAFQVYLTTKVHAQFYSCVDKSLSITVSNDDGIMIYIVKCYYQPVAYKWLSLLKQVLSEEIMADFDVHVPDLGITVAMNIPQSMVSQFLDQGDNLVVHELPQGYIIEHSGLIEHVKQVILQQIREISHVSPDCTTWLENLSNPWLCYKFYDRLEWVNNNSEIFALQNQLLSRVFHLEFRQMIQEPRKTRADGEIYVEPYPIEGYLARLTNTLGKEVSVLRTFHKISYFYSCDNILFFTKYYRGSPPSPNGELHDDDQDFTTLNDKVPEVFLKSPFDLDENDHIKWLASSDFEKHDEVALSEFERRTQEVAKAEGLLDLCSVKSIEPIPKDKVFKAHKLMQCILWYSAGNLMDDDEITDSAFQIELVNGSIVKLQAPNRRMRNEWIDRLLELTRYWRHHKFCALSRKMDARKKNLELLKINEFVDSNIVQEGESYEFRNSFADPFTHNIGSLAMSKPILMSGLLYEKHKKHSNFNQYFVVLCPGFLLLFTMYRRSKATGAWKKSSYFEHYLTIPIAEAYVYSGISTATDLLDTHKEIDPTNPGHHVIPRIYADGWKSSEEEPLCCFTLWFGKKRMIAGRDKSSRKQSVELEDAKDEEKSQTRNNMGPKNPGIVKMIKKLGVTGKSVVFMARSRQEREIWVSRIYTEIDRFYKGQ